MFGKKPKVPTVDMTDGHFYWYLDGKTIDMGLVSAEDLKLLAYVTEEARVRMPQRKRAPITVRTLSRASALASRFYTLTPKQ